MKAPTKRDQLRLLIGQGWSAADAAEIAGTSEREAYRVKVLVLGERTGKTVLQRLAALEQGQSDLRKYVLFKFRERAHISLPEKPGLRRVG